MAQEKCHTCNGTGWDSEARRAGMLGAPSILQPIGVHQCWTCGGTGKVGLTEEQERALAEALKRQSTNMNCKPHCSSNKPSEYGACDCGMKQLRQSKGNDK